mmetsp:Transcript_6681/g.14618  ORF Transcript_6681/g.14618 Transcript_6681/m.14618 type:complete len:939 (+) Transcript_6681:75-2891(+)
MAPIGSFVLGQLVETTAAVQTREGVAVPSGEQGQLVDWLGSSWRLKTFDDREVEVSPSQIRELLPDDIIGFDLALGPRSEQHIVAKSMVSLLHAKGHFVCKTFLSSAVMTELSDAAKDCDKKGHFVRLPVELEEGYLGRDGYAKTLLLNVEAAPDAALSGTAMLRAEEILGSVGSHLLPHLEAEFGTGIYSRSDILLSMPFEEDEEDTYAVPDLDNQGASDFLNMMWRAGLQVILNAGPAVGTLRLLPKSEANVETTLKLLPGCMAVFRPSSYKFFYRPGGLTMSVWYLDAPSQYVLSDDMDISELKPLLLGGGGGPQGFPRGSAEPCVVCAMSTRYGGGMNAPDKLFLGYQRAGYDGGLEFPIARWDLNIYYEQDADPLSGKSYTKHGGFMEGVELFDNKFFDISNSEAMGMDPTQRQVMETSYIALSEAGWTKKMLQSKPANIGVWVGLDKNEWQSMPKEMSSTGASSGANAITSNRFSYSMNLKGASMTVDTACSSSLVATHTAKLYLFYKHTEPCEAVLTCGVNLSLSPGTYIGGCAAGMHSHIGRCFTFNASADGYMRGESVAAHVMKTMAYDPDNNGSLTMVAGSQANQDGRSASLTAPNGPSQEKCNRATLREGMIDPIEVDSTECHGTGTSLGDPIEVGAYRKVMMASNRAEPVCATSCKSNLGHCEGSAGISGFLKCCLMCLNSQIAGNQHLRTLNAHLDVSGFPVIFLSEGITARASASIHGVLSFGFGGTNSCAQVWGEDLLTSRGGYAQSADLPKLLMDKVHRAPPPEVTITGPDWEDWEVEGPGRQPKAGEVWGLRLDEDGVVSFERRQRDEEDLGSHSYFAAGSYNNWSFEQLEPDDMLSGLHYTTMVLGQSGEEQFQIVANSDMSMVFSPTSTSCTQRSCAINGPSSASREYAWCIRGKPGDRYRIEWYISESNSCSVNWYIE